ncbi:Bor/Iss family lipoprotein [Pseudoteredinibacter isoporae]|uniref:Bor/Iss family lipoprotein n=1 Tax=Pseudoteredinibacter isoporae TaxID=570281 RepID=UPI003103D8B8
MKKLSCYALVLSGLLAISGCSRIHFVQYEQENNQQKETRWHHTTLNGLVELSPPLNLSEVCRGKAWNHVTTETTFGNWAASLLNPTVPYLVLYSPRTNQVQCYQVPIKSETDKGV